MATNREMLKEAIADAKAVKETAIANAKVALEEAFTPQLKSMFAAKLQEMEIEEEKIEEYGMEHDTASIKDMDKDGDTDVQDAAMMEVDLEELLRELELEEDDTLNEAEEDDDDDMKMSDEDSDEDNEEGTPIDLEDMTDEDLKSMIEDVIADMIKSGELKGENTEEEEKMDMDMEMEPEDEEVDLAELLKEIEEMDEMEEPIDEVSSTGLSDMSALITIASVFTGIGVPLIRQYFKQRKADKNAIETFKKSIEGLSPEQAEEKIEKELKAFGPEQAPTQSESAHDSELSEAYSTIKVLKSELNEINLLNAKLLYTNKIFKAKNLNESQKVKVLTSFDKAKNVGEVKMVFETLNEGIKVSKNIIKENLGRASKGTITPNVNKPIVESNEAFLRMQKLAGII
jgi:hypothetical protein